MVLPDPAFIAEFVAVVAFGLVYIISLFIWRPIAERSKLKHREWTGLSHVASAAYAGQTNGGGGGGREEDGVTIARTDYRAAADAAVPHSEARRDRHHHQHVPKGRVHRLAQYSYNGADSDADGSSAEEGRVLPQTAGYLPAVATTMIQGRGGEMLYARLTRRLREFHRSAIASGVALVVGILAMFHLSVLIDATLLIRIVDGVAINPWRWIFALSWLTGIGHAFVCMAHQHHMLSILAIAFHGGLSRVLLGLALLLEPFSSYFWGVVIGAMVLALISFLLLWFHPPTIYGVGRVAGPGGMVARMTFWWIALTAIVHFVFFFGSYEVGAWFSVELTHILFVVADAVLFVFPGIYLLTRHYYKYTKHSWPLLPRFVYADYGIDPYWSIQAQPMGVETQLMANTANGDADGSGGSQAPYYASETQVHQGDDVSREVNQ